MYLRTPWGTLSLSCSLVVLEIVFFVFSKVKERCTPLLYESQQLLTPLEELEKQITFFYESLGKIKESIRVLEHEAQSSALFKQKHQVRRKHQKKGEAMQKGEAMHSFLAEKHHLSEESFGTRIKHSDQRSEHLS